MYKFRPVSLLQLFPIFTLIFRLKFADTQNELPVFATQIASKFHGFHRVIELIIGPRASLQKFGDTCRRQTVLRDTISVLKL